MTYEAIGRPITSPIVKALGIKIVTQITAAIPPNRIKVASKERQ